MRRDFPRLISLIEQGKLDVGAMVTRTMHLHEVNDAINAMQNGEVIRSVLSTSDPQTGGTAPPACRQHAESRSRHRGGAMRA